MKPTLTTPDWSRLDALRQIYLQGTAGFHDYWSDEALLAAYDQTFAQRIGWKWQWVLCELDQLGWTPPRGAVLDWGCGSGIASRTFYTHYRPHGIDTFYFYDRSRTAMTYAVRQLKKQAASVTAQAFSHTSAPTQKITTVLLSHVLTELDDSALQECLHLVHTAECVLWVEPGAKDVSRRLSQIRDQLMNDFYPIAPCLARGACPLLSKSHTHDWCHFFASPPTEAFTSATWAEFARALGIDLRSLPVSYLVLSRQPLTPAQITPQSQRVLGSPRFYKGYALIQSCDGSQALTQRFSKRTDPALFKAWEKNRLPTHLHWQARSGEITELTVPKLAPAATPNGSPSPTAD